MKNFPALVLLLGALVLAGCLAESTVLLDDTKMPVISGLQKVQIQDAYGQPLTGANVQMTMSEGGDSEPVNTVGISNERGRLDMPRSTSATYYVTMTGYTSLTLSGKDMFGKKPVSSINYQMQGPRLVIIMQRPPFAGQPQPMFDGQQLWEQGVAEPIRKMPVVPLEPPPARK